MIEWTGKRENDAVAPRICLMSCRAFRPCQDFRIEILTLGIDSPADRTGTSLGSLGISSPAVCFLILRSCFAF